MAVDDFCKEQIVHSSSDKISVPDSQIDDLFLELDLIQIQSEVAIAYQELFNSIESPDSNLEEIKEVIQGYGINPFEYELPISGSTDIMPKQKNNETAGNGEQDSEGLQLWSPFHLALHFNRPQIVELFLK